MQSSELWAWGLPCTQLPPAESKVCCSQRLRSENSSVRDEDLHCLVTFIHFP